MNPEPPSAAGSAVPDEAHAAAAPDMLEPGAPPAACATPDNAGSDDAPDTVPDQLRELPADAAPVIAAPAAVPELSPAVTGARLTELFPALFVGPDGNGTWKPIKLRIHADIQARAPGIFTKRTLGIFFSRYTTTTAYLKALANAPQRLDLDGQAAGEISDEHRLLASDELARRQALAAERRAALRPPRRDRPAAGDSDAAPATPSEAQPDRPAGPRPEGGPERRPSNPPPGRPPQRPRGDAPRPERRDLRGPEGPPSAGERALRPPRPPRPLHPPRHTDRAPRPEHSTHHPTHHPRLPRHEGAAPMQRVDPTPAMPADPAQRERAVLLRSYEASPLSKANFCALKGMTEAALDAALTQAQAERSSR